MTDAVLAMLEIKKIEYLQASCSKILFIVRHIALASLLPGHIKAAGMPVLTLNAPDISLISTSYLSSIHDGLDIPGFSATKLGTDPRITVMIVILLISLIAVSFPAISSSGLIRIPHIIFFIGKHFGTGVILATAFIHLLPDSFSSLALGIVKERYGNVGRWTGLIILGSLLSIFLVEYISTTYVDRLHAETSAPPTPTRTPAPLPMATSTHALLPQPANLFPLVANSPKIIRLRSNTGACICTPGRDGNAVCVCVFPPEGSKPGTEDVRRVDMDDGHHTHDHDGHEHHAHHHEELHRVGRRRQIVGILVLQLGIMIHSLVIGLTLSVTSGADFTSLTTAIIFHQLFEGLSLGIRIAALPRSTHKAGEHKDDPPHTDNEDTEHGDVHSNGIGANVSQETEDGARPPLQRIQSESHTHSHLHRQDSLCDRSQSPPQSAYPQIQLILPDPSDVGDQTRHAVALDTISPSTSQQQPDPLPIIITGLDDITEHNYHSQQATVNVNGAQSPTYIRRNHLTSITKSNYPASSSSSTPDSRSRSRLLGWKSWESLFPTCCRRKRERKHLHEGQGFANGVDEPRDGERARPRGARRKWHLRVNSLKLTLSVLFGVTTPLGMAIGMAVWRRGTDGADEAQVNLIQGLMSAISAGMLIYVSTVEMIAGDFVFGDVEGHHHGPEHGHHHHSAHKSDSRDAERPGDSSSGGKPAVQKASLGKKAIAVISLVMGVVGMVLVGLGEKD